MVWKPSSAAAREKLEQQQHWLLNPPSENVCISFLDSFKLLFTISFENPNQSNPSLTIPSLHLSSFLDG